MRSPSDYIIFPLDVASRDEAKELVGLLAGHVGMFKIGLELFIRSGPDLIAWIRSAYGTAVFLDLKLHDIPATVERAMRGVSDLGVALATVHCGESPQMLKAAVAGAGPTGVLGVTVLTSVAIEDLRQSGLVADDDQGLDKLVLHRAQMARDAGCAGVVCSAQEAGMIKARWGAALLAVTPGIRPAWEGVGHQDQKRVVTPAEAIRQGSDYLVIGRPIRDAARPVDAARRAADEIGAALAGEPFAEDG
ncbi:MAG: orotidine-5'-phosphate decarboxylase [Desulfobacterales bacterium]|nr:orotidine-5'-phosphate decarboxylase [Desulfobacterales bacterium]